MPVYADVALDAVRWLGSVGIETAEGVGWPAEPGGPVDDSLYAGTPGVVLAMLAAHHATGDEQHLTMARRGVRHLTGVIEAEDGLGLYTGTAGVGFALQAMATLGADDSAAEGYTRAVDLCSAGVTDEPGTDIIFGKAGIGLFLLAAGSDQAVSAAARAGEGLLGQAIEIGDGLKWSVGTRERFMPNFSHGTAGVASFLARLHRATGEERFLDAALAGARYLLSVAHTDDGGCAVFHYEGGGEDSYPLGWCHGPTGLARIFHILGQETDDAAWATWRDRCTHTVRTSGIPERREPGFWDNVGACCGSVAVGQMFLDLHRMTRQDDHLAFCRVMADDVLERATTDGDGTRWSNIEHRVDPPDLAPQTGAMQGAAGIVLHLLQLDAHLGGDPWRVAWPDSPF